MAQNIEIKAFVSNLTRALDLLTGNCASSGDPEEQIDIFFFSPTGRIKLRYCGPETGILIFYERRDRAEPKLSTYETYVTHNPKQLEKVLRASYDVELVVRKVRRKFGYRNAIIHLDSVQDLGDFIEVEVELDGHQSREEIEALMCEIVGLLEINPGDLVKYAYADLIKAKDLCNGKIKKWNQDPA